MSEINIDPEVLKKWQEQGTYQCKVCGCTESEACPGGCYWVEKDLCSNCVGETKDE